MRCGPTAEELFACLQVHYGHVGEVWFHGFPSFFCRFRANVKLSGLNRAITPPGLQLCLLAISTIFLMSGKRSVMGLEGVKGETAGLRSSSEHYDN
jgi:hypothetical protein